MKIIETSIVQVKQYENKECSFSYNGETFNLKIGKVTLEIEGLQTLAVVRPENRISVFTDYGTIELAK